MLCTKLQSLLLNDTARREVPQKMRRRARVYIITVTYVQVQNLRTSIVRAVAMRGILQHTVKSTSDSFVRRATHILLTPNKSTVVTITNFHAILKHSNYRTVFQYISL